MDNRAARPGRRTDLLGRASECALLEGLIEDVRRGKGRSLVLTGEAGIGKTALLEYVIEAASDVTVVRAAGVESEMELAYASLHQLCGPLLDRIGKLPRPQRQALEIVFGLSGGTGPDRFLVGLAVLSMLSEVSNERPVLCVIDDAQWLDRSSALTLAFVARRLLAEPVGLVFAAREPGDELRNLPDLEIGGLRNGDARILLSSTARFKFDEQVRDRIVAETRGNPLALLELPRGLSAKELAGFEAGTVAALPSSLEESFRRRLEALPDETRRLLLIAAADPVGEPTLVWRAARLHGIGAETSAPAARAGLCEFGVRVRFRHPLVRGVVYRDASPDERRRAHAAIAEATDADADPDRRAWHRALAAAGPDEEVANELERSAARARARGGQAAAAALLERSVDLTIDPARRAERAVAAAEAKHLAGSAEEALRLGAVAEQGSVEELHRVRVDVLRGRVAMMQRRGSDAPLLLLSAARRLERFDRRLARETYRDAFGAASYAGHLAGDAGLRAIAVALRSAQPPADAPSATDELLDAAALLVDGGYEAGAPRVRRALAAFRAAPLSPDVELRWLWLACRLCHEVWDHQTWDVLSARQLELVRDAGVLALLPLAVAMRVGWDLFAGDLAGAAAIVAEHDAVLDAIGSARSPTARIALAAFRGREAEVSQLDVATTSDAVARGEGQWMVVRHWATALLYNGLGRYEEALTAAQQGATYAPDMGVANWALTELVEAAALCGRPEAAAEAVGRLSEMARGCGTDWILGVVARARAVVADPADADESFCDAIGHLARTRARAELARAHLLYGEWLRRQARDIDARKHLHVAYEMLAAIGMEAFAERARGGLQASGEEVQTRTVRIPDQLTPQERQIARLAADGLSNPDIGAQLFLSPRTVEWHLHNAFNKLGIRSRRQLTGALKHSDSEQAPF